jgi:hypothetical protein
MSIASRSLKKRFFEGKAIEEIAQEKRCSMRNIEKQFKKVLLLAKKGIKTENNALK